MANRSGNGREPKRRFDRVDDRIRVHFSKRGSGDVDYDGTPTDKDDPLLGLAEGMWADVISVKPNDEFPISITNIIQARLCNTPVWQVDKETGARIERGDICEFSDDGYVAAEFVCLIKKRDPDGV